MSEVLAGLPSSYCEWILFDMSKYVPIAESWETDEEAIYTTKHNTYHYHCDG